MPKKTSNHHHHHHHSVEPQTVLYGKKNFKSIVAQWMGRLEL
jgi:hypothetical protein